MKRMCIIGSITMALAGGLWLLTGCEDKEIAHQKEVEVDDGQVTTEETTVRETDGGVQVEKKTTERENDDGVIETETTRQTETIPNPDN